VAAAESVYGGLGVCARGSKKREKRKDNAEALSSLRFAEEEGFTTEDTKNTEKQEGCNCKCGRLR
jgi:hypothetical protein